MNLTKKQKIGAGVGAVALLAAIIYWKHAASSSATSSTGADPNAIDPLTGMPFAQDQTTDPITGLTYLQEAQQYGSVAAAEAAFSGASSESGYSAGYGASSGGTAGYPTSNVGGSTTPNGYSTNAQWSQAVTAGLAQLGYDPQAIGAALGAFFAQMQLTSDQAAIVQAAEAEFGAPPQGTYAIVTAPSSGSPGGSGSGGTGSGTPPSGGTGGGTGPASTGRLPAPSGLQLKNGKTGVEFTWAPVKGATGYVCQLKRGGENGPNQNGPFTVTTASCNFGQLTAGTQYTALIWPSDSADQGGPASNQPHVQRTFVTTK